MIKLKRLTKTSNSEGAQQKQASCGDEEKQVGITNMGRRTLALPANIYFVYENL